MRFVTDQVLIASDHAGLALKEHIKSKFQSFRWTDLGPADEGRVDYPDYADLVAAKMNRDGGWGILICGSGQGMAIRANRYPNVRAAVAWDEESARLSREHNNANILCLGARLLSQTEADNILRVFFATDFEGGRHAVRVEKLKGALK